MDAKEVGQIILATTKDLQGWDGVIDIALVGSALYMPAEKIGDVDFVVLLAAGNDALQYIDDTIKDAGWEWCGEYDTQGGEWGAIRSGPVNLIVTHSREFFDGFRAAAEVCKALRLGSKLDRMIVHRVVRDGLSADEARAAVGAP